MEANYFSGKKIRNFQILFIILHCSIFISQAQTPQGSSTLIQACIRNTNCYHTKTPSYIYYDEGKSELILKIDLSRAGQDDSLGKWVQGINQFDFRASLNKEKFPSPSNYNASNVSLDGITTINGVSHKQTLDVTLYQVEGNFTSNRAGNNTIYDAYRINFSIPIVPGDYDLGSDIKGTLFISVNSGVINQVNPAGNLKPE